MSEEYTYSTKHLFLEYAGTNIQLRLYTPISIPDISFQDVDFSEITILDALNNVIIRKDQRDYPLVFDYDSSNEVTLVDFVPIDTKFVVPAAYHIQLSMTFTCGEVLKYFYRDALHILKPYLIVPEIIVKQGSNVIPNNAAPGYDYGTKSVGSSTPITFTIQNDGAGYLDITTISFISGDVGDFAIDVTGMESRIQSLGSINFNILFKPTVVGNRSVVLSIVNSDFRNNPYKFEIVGAGL